MSGRGTNRLGYSTPQSALTPSELNDVYTHGSFWIPAGSLTPSESNPISIETYEGTEGPLDHTYTVAKYLNGVQQSGCFEWGFKSDFMAVPSASLLLKMSPLWFAKTTAGSGSNEVHFEGYASNILLDNSVNDSRESGLDLLQDVPGTAFDLTGGKIANAQASLARTVGGSTLSSSDWNVIRLTMERHGDLDEFADSVFLIGIGIQFAVDFNNVAVWPT